MIRYRGVSKEEFIDFILGYDIELEHMLERVAQYRYETYIDPRLGRDECKVAKTTDPKFSFAPERIRGQKIIYIIRKEQNDTTIYSESNCTAKEEPY